MLLAKREGRFTGEAYVLFGSAAHIQVALDRNKTYLGRRYVEVFKAKKLVRGGGRPEGEDAGLPPPVGPAAAGPTARQQTGAGACCAQQAAVAHQGPDQRV